MFEKFIKEDCKVIGLSLYVFGEVVFGCFRNYSFFYINNYWVFKLERGIFFLVKYIVRNYMC